jgi:hypothetical protein
MGRGGELAHVGADLGHDHLRCPLVDPGDGVQQRHLLGVGGDHLLDPRREGGDGLVQVVDVGQDLGDQQPMLVGAEPAGQRLPQRWQLGPEPNSWPTRPAPPGRGCRPPGLPAWPGRTHPERQWPHSTA